MATAATLALGAQSAWVQDVASFYKGKTVRFVFGAGGLVALNRVLTAQPDVSSVFAQAKRDADQRWWLEFRMSINDLGRILVITPGTPADRLAFLRAAVKSASACAKLCCPSNMSSVDRGTAARRNAAKGNASQRRHGRA